MLPALQRASHPRLRHRSARISYRISNRGYCVYSATTFWLAVLAALIIGFIAGAIVSRNLGSNPLRNRENQRAIDTLRQEQQHYRDQVTGHFQRTAELVNELTENYRAVHNHLAQGARELCPEAGSQLPHLPEPPAAAQQLGAASAAAPIEPPRDYAPRAHADLGPLHEAYGLDKGLDKNRDKSHTGSEPPRH